MCAYYSPIPDITVFVNCILDSSKSQLPQTSTSLDRRELETSVDHLANRHFRREQEARAGSSSGIKLTAGIAKVAKTTSDTSRADFLSAHPDLIDPADPAMGTSEVMTVQAKESSVLSVQAGQSSKSALALRASSHFPLSGSTVVSAISPLSSEGTVEHASEPKSALLTMAQQDGVVEAARVSVNPLGSDHISATAIVSEHPLVESRGLVLENASATLALGVSRGVDESRVAPADRVEREVIGETVASSFSLMAQSSLSVGLNDKPQTSHVQTFQEVASNVEGISSKECLESAVGIQDIGSYGGG